MTGEGVYLCEKCGAEVKMFKKPVQDLKWPMLLRCGKPMVAKGGGGRVDRGEHQGYRQGSL